MPRRPLDPDDPAILRIAARIDEIKATLSRDNVETIREWGAELASAASLMRDKDYRAWLDDVVKVSHAAAANYRRLHRLSEESPALFLRWKTLGPSKLYHLARLSKPARTTALKEKIAGKSVAEMSDATFAVLMSRFRDPSRRKVTPAMRAHGLRMRIRTMLTDLEHAQTLAPLPPDSLAKLTTDLTTLSKAATTLLRTLRSR